ncbi:T7SS effector LXG polymorphic toxin [Enterococcus faecalis]|uniref:LXG domain-containing protein n=1 Tax=Enterococcus faecalis ATCC 6055 TaxID=1169311 RepID=R3JZS4_ENTFL|nr:T7SS effector LXG polymorphic toxin [Enterococcus faecalis]EOK06761.1 hypothetical protein WOU_03134 [Enterococcus faecalis ATCC 6055]
MRLVYVSSESSKFMSDLKTNLNAGKEAMNQLKTGSQKVVSAVDGHQLAGAAYTAGKGLFSELIIPTITRTTNALEKVEQELQKYKTADSFVSGEGKLDEDKLTKEIQTLQSMKHSIDSTRDFVQSMSRNHPVADMIDTFLGIQRNLTRQSETMRSNIKDVEKKLRMLREFNGKTSSLFQNSLNELKIAMQGVMVLNNTTVNADGSYSLPSGVDKSWFTEVKKQSLEEKAIENAIKDMPENLSEAETENWLLANIEKYGLPFLDILRKNKKWASRGQKVLDNIIKWKNGKAFLNGTEIIQDASGALKIGKKFLYDPTKGLGETTKNLFKPAKFDGTFKMGKEFKEKTGIDLAKHKYARLPNGKIDYTTLTKSGMSKFKDSVNVTNDFKGWKEATKVGRLGKGLGLLSTGFTIGDNFNKYVDFSDGIQGDEIRDFTVDTAVDIGSSAGASAAGAMVGSLFLPPLGTVVGAGVGMGVSMVINFKFGGPPKQSLVDHTKTEARKVAKGIGNMIGKASKWVFG